MIEPSPPLKVLVVDDDFMVSSVHRRFVESLDGFTVVGEAGTGGQALAAIEADQPDLVLLDIYLPDMSGLDVLRRVRATGSPVDVLVVTAARDVDTVRESLRGGVIHYLVKPFTGRDLAERLHAYRDRHAALGRHEDETDVEQTELDSIFGAARPTPAQQASLPKGLSAETLTLVTATVRALGPDETLSAQECADKIGMARVSTRRYLEHLVAAGVADVGLRYGTTGRPERRYRRAT